MKMGSPHNWRAEGGLQLGKGSGRRDVLQNIGGGPGRLAQINVMNLLHDGGEDL